MATNNKPPIIVNGNTTTLGFPKGMSQASIQAALKKQGTPVLNLGGDKGLANRAAAAAAQKPAASKATSNSSELKNRAAAKAPVKKTTTSKPATSSSSSAVGVNPAQSFMAGAQDNFGYNPNVGYNPVDTSKIMDLLGKWDPNSVAAVYDPAYQNLDRLRSQGKSDYDTGDAKLSSIYDMLQGSIRGSADSVRGAYDTARQNINTDATNLSQAAAQDAVGIQNNRAAMLKNLGIEAAAPDLVANDNAAAQTGQRVTQAAGVQSNLASILGANAYAYQQDTANNAGLQGAEARTGLLGQYNDYLGDLAGKQSDIDSARAQAINTAYQNYNSARQSLGMQKMQFDFQNAQNSYNAANQNNQNAMSMFNNFSTQQNAELAANLQAQSDRDKLNASNQQYNTDLELKKRQLALDEQKARASSSGGSGDLYSAMGQVATQYGLTGTSFNDVMAALSNTSAKGGLGNNPGDFANRAATLVPRGVDPNVMRQLAYTYYQNLVKATNSRY